MATSITTDYFLGRAIAVQQMKGVGHRSGLDAIMLAATLPQELQGQVADLGAGAGVVGLAAAHRCRQCHVDLIEIDPQLEDLSNQSLQLVQNQHLVNRVTSHCTDITQSGEPLLSCGRKPGSYAAILCNPPYNDASHQASPDKQRALAHMGSAEAIDVWIKTAANMAAHRGLLAMILRPANLLDFANSIGRSFGNIIIKPLHPRVDEPASRLLVGSIKNSRAALKVLPPLMVHRGDGGFTGEADDILRGRRAIDLFA